MSVRLPTKLDPGFSFQKTTDLKRVIEQWGVVPMAYLSLLAEDQYTYGYIGTEDLLIEPCASAFTACRPAFVSWARQCCQASVTDHFHR